MSFVKNYGLYWSRERVDWGSRGRGNKGSLMGLAPPWSTPAVDFRDQAGVYVLYDGADIPSSRVTYVGQAARASGDALYARLREHQWDHLWNRWNRFSWFGMFEVGKYGDLVHANIEKTYADSLANVVDHLEGALVTILEPLLNKRGANWGDAVQYFQPEVARDDTVNARLDALTAEIAALRASKT